MCELIDTLLVDQPDSDEARNLADTLYNVNDRLTGVKDSVNEITGQIQAVAEKVNQYQVQILTELISIRESFYRVNQGKGTLKVHYYWLWLALHNLLAGITVHLLDNSLFIIFMYFYHWQNELDEVINDMSQLGDTYEQMTPVGRDTDTLQAQLDETRVR